MFALMFSQFHFRRLWQSNLGAVATEYAFVIAFIAIVAATGMSLLGVNLQEFYDDIGAAFSEAGCAMPDTASGKGKGKSKKCKDKKP